MTPHNTALAYERHDAKEASEVMRVAYALGMTMAQLVKEDIDVTLQMGHGDLRDVVY